MHQLRGRVGRSNKEGFCYFIVENKSKITSQAIKRLVALESNSYLGSGSALAYQDLEIDGIVTLPMSRVEALLIKNVADLIIISEIKNHPGKVSIRYSRATKLKVKMLECLYADDIKTRSMLDQQNWVHIPNHIHDENHAYSLQVSLREALLIDNWLLPDSICNSVTLKGLLGQKTHINDNITRQIALLILCGGVEGGQIFSDKFTLNRLVDAVRVGQKNHILPYRQTNLS